MTNNQISPGQNVQVITKTTNPSKIPNIEASQSTSKKSNTQASSSLKRTNTGALSSTSKRTNTEASSSTSNNIPSKIPKQNVFPFVPPSPNIIFSTKGARKSFVVPLVVSPLTSSTETSEKLIIIPPSQVTERDPVDQDHSQDEEFDFSFPREYIFLIFYYN